MERKPESHCATWGWIGLLGYVALWDFQAPESLTHGAERARMSRIGQVLVPAAAIYTTLHVLGALPRDYDLFYKIIELRHEPHVENS